MTALVFALIAACCALVSAGFALRAVWLLERLERRRQREKTQRLIALIGMPGVPT